MSTPKKKILILCSDERNQAVFSSILAEKDLNVIKAYSREKAIELAESHKPDLVILDFDVADFKGGDLAYAIKEKRSDKTIPFVFVTSLISEAEQKCRYLGGPTCFLSKPPDKERLLEVIDRLL